MFQIQIYFARDVMDKEPFSCKIWAFLITAGAMMYPVMPVEGMDMQHRRP